MHQTGSAQITPSQKHLATQSITYLSRQHIRALQEVRNNAAAAIINTLNSGFTNQSLEDRLV
ncbi:hypothetical protein AUC60_17050 [Pseudomonas caspiana]|uniref:Uncharacterized protein n=1 Tax=Pseudomonas caspiana TaxID=1451454 RepID=A0A1Y3NY54_9PSED|nr:hypothetical protein AUC60_17050 [Pseudomonas caspiana]